tara:strand:+ start:162 stop:428 length:267 start_codon:yes stop_codon:yes gene_type:complete
VLVVVLFLLHQAEELMDQIQFFQQLHQPAAEVEVLVVVQHLQVMDQVYLVVLVVAQVDMVRELYQEEQEILLPLVLHKVLMVEILLIQ